MHLSSSQTHTNTQKQLHRVALGDKAGEVDITYYPDCSASSTIGRADVKEHGVSKDTERSEFDQIINGRRRGGRLSAWVHVRSRPLHAARRRAPDLPAYTPTYYYPTPVKTTVHFMGRIQGLRAQLDYYFMLLMPARAQAWLVDVFTRLKMQNKEVFTVPVRTVSDMIRETKVEKIDVLKVRACVRAWVGAAGNNKRVGDCLPGLVLFGLIGWSVGWMDGWFLCLTCMHACMHRVGILTGGHGGPRVRDAAGRGGRALAHDQAVRAILSCRCSIHTRARSRLT